MRQSGSWRALLTAVGCCAVEHYGVWALHFIAHNYVVYAASAKMQGHNPVTG